MHAATASAVATAQQDRPLKAAEPRMHLQSGHEELLLNLDLSDLVLPKVNDLHVDGLKSSWLSRLLGGK